MDKKEENIVIRRFLPILLCTLCINVIFGQTGRLEEYGSFLFIPNMSDALVDEVQTGRELDALAIKFKSLNLVPGSIKVHGYAARSNQFLVYSTGLAYNRAVFIIGELQKRGIAWELFATPVGYGENSVFGNEPAENRRVTVNVIDLPPVGETENLRIAELLERLEKLESVNQMLMERTIERRSGTDFFYNAFFGIGPEINLNTRGKPKIRYDYHNNPIPDDYIPKFSVGGYFCAGFEFIDTIALGLRINLSHDLAITTTLEPALLFRWFLPFKGIFKGVYAEANVGTACYIEEDEPLASVAPLAAIGAGWRFRIGKHFYIEPALRIGMPFTIGAGFNAGLLLK